MSSKSGGIISRIWKSFKLAKGASPPRLVGKDHLGNCYYEIQPNEHTIHKHKMKAHRLVVPPNFDISKIDLTHSNFDIPEVQSGEWEAWLRYRRSTPPTEEELNSSMRAMHIKQGRAAELEKKYEKEREQLIKDGLINPESDKPLRIHSNSEFPLYEGVEVAPGDDPNWHEQSRASQKTTNQDNPKFKK